METNKILYFADGNNLTVTDSGLRMRNVFFPLEQIYSHKVSVVSPNRTPFAIFAGAGILTFVCGAMNFLPSSWQGSMSIFGVSLVTNALIMLLGLVVMLGAIFLKFQAKAKYAVKLSTSEGEKTIIVTTRQEYVYKFIDALNHAFLNLMKKPRSQSAEQLRRAS